MLTQDLIRGPAHRGDGGDSQALVDLCPAGVVDTCDHLLQAECLARHARRDDVGVISVGHGRERVRAPDPGLLQHRLVEAISGDLVAVERGTESAERIGLAVDHRDGVIAVLQTASEIRTDAAAAHDHDVHAETLSQSVCGKRR
jgi:hypothetical protein